MKKIKEIFFVLLRWGLWGTVNEKMHLDLTEAEWKALYQMSVIQTVQGIIYDGIKLIPDNEKPSIDFFQRWNQEVKRIEKENTKQLAKLVQLKYFFEAEHQLRFVLLKGQTLARHYRNPLHRFCGDMDLWFKTDGMVEEANNLLEHAGVDVLRGHAGGGEYNWYGTPVEHKSHLIELSNPLMQHRLRVWEHEIFDNSTDEPTAEANLLLQMTHILKHYVKGGGLGFRHLCDLALSFTALDYNADEVMALCKEFGIYRWADMLTALIHQVLDVPLERLPFPCKEDPEPLLEEMWIAGNFGVGDNRFGNHPRGRWGSKLYTARRVWHKTRTFYRVAPGECFWNLTSMVGNNIITLFRKN